MPYYDTIEKDLTVAKEILARGRRGSGTFDGADSYAAYKLLESFVAEIERLTEVLHHEGIEHSECQEALISSQMTCTGLRAEIVRLRDLVASHEEELGELQPKYIAAVNGRAELQQFLGLFSDYEELCQGFAHAEAIWNAMKDRESRLHDKIHHLEQQIDELQRIDSSD